MRFMLAVALILCVSPAVSQTLEAPRDLFEVMAEAPTFDPNNPSAFKPTIVWMSPCTISEASLTSARCAIRSDGRLRFFIELEFGWWENDKWEDTMIAPIRADIAKRCGSDNDKPECAARLRGFAYRYGRNFGGDLIHRFRVFDVDFLK